MGKKGPKIEIRSASLLQKSAHDSGEVAEIEICARIIRQEKWLMDCTTNTLKFVLRL